MRRPRRAWTTLTLGILATGGCGERGVPDSGPRPWSLEASVLEAGEGLPFCEETMARVDAFMSRFEGQVPPSDQYGGSATAGTPNEMPGLNAHVIAENTSLQHQIFINHMTLVRYDEDKNPQPYLAESWVVSGDNREITFHTRDDVYWHDGELTDAYDVAYTVERATDPETGFQNSGWWTYMETGPGAIEVIDSFTIRFRMTPHADFMDMGPCWRSCHNIFSRMCLRLSYRHILTERCVR
jgi:ABC-type transport system substrate-binding protein